MWIRQGHTAVRPLLATTPPLNQNKAALVLESHASHMYFPYRACPKGGM
jgi:hypothetical protein